MSKSKSTAEDIIDHFTIGHGGLIRIDAGAGVAAEGPIGEIDDIHDKVASLINEAEEFGNDILAFTQKFDSMSNKEIKRFYRIVKNKIKPCNKCGRLK